MSIDLHHRSMPIYPMQIPTPQNHGVTSPNATATVLNIRRSQSLEIEHCGTRESRSPLLKIFEKACNPSPLFEPSTCFGRMSAFRCFTTDRKRVQISSYSITPMANALPLVCLPTFSSFMALTRSEPWVAWHSSSDEKDL